MAQNFIGRPFNGFFNRLLGSLDFEFIHRSEKTLLVSKTSFDYGRTSLTGGDLRVLCAMQFSLEELAARGSSFRPNHSGILYSVGQVRAGCNREV